TDRCGGELADGGDGQVHPRLREHHDVGREVRIEAERVGSRGVVDGQRPWGQSHLTAVLDEQTVSVELKRDLEVVRRGAVFVRPGPGDQPGGAQNRVRIGVDL